MSEKVLKLQPHSMVCYLSASVKVFGVKPKISQAQYSKFVKFDKTLHELRILPQEYATKIMTHLKQWVHKRKWKTLPVNVYVGKWATNMYLNEIGGNRSFVYISLSKEQEQLLVMEEVLILQASTDWGVDYEEAFESLKPMLSDVRINLIGEQLQSIKTQAQALYKQRYGNV